jgi:hypothetical protein
MAIGRWISALFASLGLIFGSVVVASPAEANATPILAGSSWFGGGGVNVCSASTDPYCGSEYKVGTYSANWWQCVELAQRFYSKTGWHSGLFGVSYAYQIYDNASSLGMTRQANGSITSIVPGDMIIHGSSDPYSPGAGHVAIVDSISGSTVNVVEQNGSSTGRAIYTLSSGTLTRGIDVVSGVVHDPDNVGQSISGDPILIMNTANQVWAKNTIGYGGWSDQGPVATKIAVGGNRMAMLDSTGHVWAKDGLSIGGWSDQGAVARDLIVTSTGRLVITNTDGWVFAKDGLSYGGWSDQGVNAATVAADGNSNGDH